MSGSEPMWAERCDTMSRAETSVEVIEVEGTKLYHRYPGQTSSQPCQVELDCERRVLRARYNPEIGNAIPVREYHGHVRTWGIPALRGDVATALLHELAPLAERVCDGYESRWNGSNHVAVFDKDATAALEAIDDSKNRYWDESDHVRVWTADEYYGHETADHVASLVGITVDTTDEDLEDLAETQEAQAASDGIDEVEGLREHLEWARDQLRNE